MKIIFSRKGFDSAAGGFPSLIFPDNTLFSIPIPSGSGHCHYSKLAFEHGDEPIQEILNQVTGSRIRNKGKRYRCDYAQAAQGCHHDPMYFRESSRLILGQTERSESHLRNQKVAAGDVFLFYGWFKRIARVDGRWTYLSNARDIHLIWSWMTLASPLKLDSREEIDYALEIFPELNAHPHLASDWSAFPNGVYVSGEHALHHFSNHRCLTDIKSYNGRAQWRLPICFNQPQAFSHLKSFSPEDNEVVINYRGYGQEFVLDLEKVASNEDRDEILRFVKNAQTR